MRFVQKKSLILITSAVIAIVSLIGLKLINSFSSGLILGACILLNFWLLYILVVPKEYGKTKLRRVTVAIIFTTFGFLVFILKDENLSIINKANDVLTKKLKLNISSQNTYLIIALVILILILLLANYIIQDKTIMREHVDSFDEKFPERDFNERLKSFANFLKNRIDHLDAEANWSEAHFTPIEAEVETYSKQGKKSKISNLIKAIRNDFRSKVFLILGEPGSGKSVALRKLCRDLITEVPRTKKIPIYLNLKEWYTNQNWSENNPPTTKSLYDFCIFFLKGKDPFADDFIDRYFNRLYENGHIFFIIDSFDEIPSVLDVDESSWLIEKLSEILFNFLGGAHQSRGVLASRYFRKPTLKFKANTVLNVRPFSDFRIFTALNKYVAIDKSVIQKIFKDRQDLLPIASNPFSVGLIYSYLKDNGNKLPLNQSELYSSYIKSRLSFCSEKIEKSGFKISEILNYSIEFALYMLQERNSGLEINLSELQKEFPNVNVESVIDILVYAKIGRLGSGYEKRFSYVHRRFNEYFVIQKYLFDPSLIDLEAIPQDSRFRDAMILYCEVAPEKLAIRIADFCWNEIKNINASENNFQVKRSIHCLRFLIEGYRTRKECLCGFQNELGILITSIIATYEKSNHPLKTKIAVEALGIINEKDMEEGLVYCFKINNWWINQTAIQSCRHLQSINKKLKDRILYSLLKMDYDIILAQKQELLFSLGLSAAFRRIKMIVKLRILDIKLFYIAFSLIIFIAPLKALTASLSFLFGISLARALKRERRIKAKIVFIPTLTIARLYSSITIIGLLLFFYADYKKLNFFFWESSYRNAFSYAIMTCTFFLIPFVDLYYFIFKGINLPFSKRRSFLIAIGVVVLAVVFVGGLFFFGKFLFSLLSQALQKIIERVFVGLFTLVLIIILCKSAWSHIKDYMQYKKIKMQLFTTRQEISITYMKLNTEFFRYKFVTILQQNVTICHGEWPKTFSLTENMKSRILLAQLDEKWIGMG